MAGNVLNREFYPDQANRSWTTDISYIETAEGWLYLAVVLDLFFRRVIGWATADHLRAELACEALERALVGRKPSGELPHHSDRGSQNASAAYQAILARHHSYATRQQAADSLFDDIEVFYNRKRLYSTLNYRSPVDLRGEIRLIIPRPSAHESWGSSKRGFDRGSFLSPFSIGWDGFTS